MTSASRRLVLGAATALALVAASCGGGSSEESGSGEVEKIDQGVASEVQNQLNSTSIAAPDSTSAGAGTTAAAKPVADPQTMDDWLKLWESERAAVVKRIKDNKWGVSADGKTLTGPEGWTVDLGLCPQGWSNIEGLTDTEIKIGHTTALSGTLADYGNIGKGMDVLWDYANTSGGIKDSTGKTRKITMDHEGRRLRLGPHHPAGGGTGRLREGLRHVDARLAEHAQDLRLAQQALRAPTVLDDRPPGVG